MATATLDGMPKTTNDDGKGDRKKVSISLRMDPDLLAEIAEFCESQEFKIDRTEFLEVAARRLLDEKKRETRRDAKKNGH